MINVANATSAKRLVRYSRNTVNPKRSRIAAFFNKPDIDVISCDHCGEEPQCVRACLSDALAPI